MFITLQSSWPILYISYRVLGFFCFVLFFIEVGNEDLKCIYYLKLVTSNVGLQTPAWANCSESLADKTIKARTPRSSQTEHVCLFVCLDWAKQREKSYHQTFYIWTQTCSSSLQLPLLWTSQTRAYSSQWNSAPFLCYSTSSSVHTPAGGHLEIT